MDEMYTVIELQINNGEMAIVPPVVYTDRNVAEQAFHTAAAYAAVSSLERHSVALLNQDAFVVESVTFEH